MRKYISIFVITLFALSANSILAQDIATVLNNAQKNPLFEIISPVMSQLVFASDSTTKITKENPIDTSSIAIKGPLGVVKRTAKTTDFIAIETSKAGSIEAKLLPLINESKIVCVVKTACAEICDSQVFFYTTNWEALNSSDLIPNKSIEWFVDKKAIPEEKLAEINALIGNMNPVKFNLEPITNTITAESNLDVFLGDSFKTLEPYFTKTKTLTWNKTSFK